MYLCGSHSFVDLYTKSFFQGSSVTLRAPVSESLSQLKRDQLQKFAQYLISELPQQVIFKKQSSVFFIKFFSLITLWKITFIVFFLVFVYKNYFRVKAFHEKRLSYSFRFCQQLSDC